MQMQRAFVPTEIRALSDGEVMIRMTTGTRARDGHILPPAACLLDNYRKNPIQLWRHDPNEPIGTASDIIVGSDSIDAKVTFAPPGISPTADKVRGLVKAGVVRGVSIGFKILDAEPIDKRNPFDGLRAKKWELLECSFVSVPSDTNAMVTARQEPIGCPQEQRAASGKSASGGITPAGHSASPKTLLVKTSNHMLIKPFSEQIAALEATRQAKNARMDEILNDAAERGETPDTAEKEEFDGLEREVQEVDDHLRRLRSREKANKASAVEARGNDQEEASGSRGGSGGGVQIHAQRNVEKGIIFTRVLGCKYLSYKYGLSPIEVARSKFFDTPEVEMIVRAPIAAMNTTDATSAGPLVQLQNAVAEFVELLRPNTIIDRLTGLRRVPFNIRIGRGTADPTAYWVGEGQVKPVSSMSFDNITLQFAKIAGIVTQTEELMRFSAPSSERLVRDGLVSAVAYLSNRDFLDPTKAATGSSPASITYGVTPIVASGTTSDALRADLGSLLDEYEDDNMGDDSLVLVMTRKLAGRIGLMRNTLGGKEFPDLTRTGGFLEGIPVITSNNIVATGGSPPDGGLIVAINQSSVLLADDGGVDIDISREASLQVDSAPDSPPTGSTNLRSMWQNNEVAIKAERFMNWKKARDGAVQYISNAKYN